MILDTVKVSSIEGNMPVRSKRKMSISEAGADILMDNLSNLYNDPLLAVIREYYANAYDSHMKAGTTRPVEITLPTVFTPSFIVQDFGTGMSEDFINDVYGVYGESTKRTEQSSIGAFGLGGKSGFAIAEQFTVTSHHEGKKITVLFQKGEEGSFDVIVVSVLDTDEPNGVTITVPVDQNSISDFTDRAYKFFRHVDSGSVLVNGEAPKHFLDDSTIYSVEEDGIKIAFSKERHSDSASGVTFVMGGIPYEIPVSEIRDSVARLSVSAWRMVDIYFIVPLGSFNLTGNREGVRATKKTKDLIDKCITLLTNFVVSIVQNLVEKETDYSKVVPLVEDWNALFPSRLHKVEWKGARVNKFIPCKKTDTNQNVFPTVSSNYYKSAFSTFRQELNATQSYLVITGKVPDEFMDKNLRHASIYLKHINPSCSRLVIVESLEEYVAASDLPKLINNSMITIMDFESWREIVREFEKARRALAKEERLARGEVTPKVKSKPEYPVLNLATGMVEWTEADKISLKETVYLSSADMVTPYDPSRGPRRVVTSYSSKLDKGHGTTNLAKAISALTTAKYVVFLSGAKTYKALRKHLSGDMLSFYDEVKDLVDKLYNEATQDTIVSVQEAESETVVVLRKTMGSEHIAKIEDEDLKAAVSKSSGSNNSYRVPQILNAIDSIQLMNISAYDIKTKITNKLGISLYQTLPMSDMSKSFNDKYPLVSMISVGYRTRAAAYDHLIEYINGIHRASLQVLTDN